MNRNFMTMSQPEAAERVQPAAVASAAAVVPGQAWQKYTPEQRELAQELARRLAKLKYSVQKFIEFSDLSETVVSRVLRGLYNGNVAKALAGLANHLDFRERMARDRRARPRPAFKFEMWDDVAAAELAVRNAFHNAQDIQPDRHGETISIVDLVLPSGWGKDETFGHLSRTFGGTLIRARGSWRDSKLAAAESIAEQLGIALPLRRVVSRKGDVKTESRFWRSYSECEKAILASLKEVPRVIYFMELDLCEVALCDLWKEISNETRCVIVRFWVPEAYARMVRLTGSYGEQTNARTERVITGGAVPTELVQRLFAVQAPGVVLGEMAAAWLAGFATELQGLRCVIGVAREMADDDRLKPGQAVTLTQVRDHVLEWRQVHGLRLTKPAGEVIAYMPVPVWPRDGS